MNFLDIVQRTRRECGISGTGPLSVVGQSGEMQRLVDWCREAYLDIQSAETRWNWLNKLAVLDIAPGDRTMEPVSDWNIHPLMYDVETFGLYRTDLGPSDVFFLDHVEYHRAKTLFFNATVGRPTAFTVMPNRAIMLNATSDADYRLSINYYGEAEVLSLDADTPSMPEQYQMTIVWRAVQLYADYEEVPYLRQTSTLKYSQIFDQMLRTETPRIDVGGPLA